MTDTGQHSADMATVEATTAAQPAGDQASLWGDAWRELRRNPLFVFPSILIIVLIVMAMRRSCSPTPTRASAACRTRLDGRARRTGSASTCRAATPTRA